MDSIFSPMRPRQCSPTAEAQMGGQCRVEVLVAQGSPREMSWLSPLVKARPTGPAWG